ncbi:MULTISPECIES: hypothetical protein [unclassified Streptomyces]|nr:MULTISPECIES: hypothetical protein [unclassified Streptomyces]
MEKLWRLMPLFSAVVGFVPLVLVALPRSRAGCWVAAALVLLQLDYGRAI